MATDSQTRTKALDELDRLDQHIVDCGQRIAEQRKRLESLMHSGGDIEDSENLLKNLVGSLGALNQLRKMVLSEVHGTDR
ncbi:hypothetical protein AWB78_05799 [Caballeronia calidae]|uniref:Uncharacterized protein n=1 Tax=Caballeronia calidae TaxID=1777139 RepID=A0A158DY41_9BURK|nr:hypothetical protein [Caballeronia calidae]SAK99555.1 hypothetical protein AWB78_05799 [Caballeronia calidae]